jgi:hypothetical protein
MKIFVQIASYRDPELAPTIKSLLDNSKYPKNLSICIHNQFSESDTFNKNIDQYRKDKRFIIIDTPYLESKGACWARNTIQQKYNNEEYTLQLDSHHRFVKDWDDECITMIKQLQKKGYNKPLLTGYIPSYNPENDPVERVNAPWQMNFDRFIPEGAIFFLPAEISDWETLNQPILSRFYSAHFCFTLGSFTKEVQHDPEYYFHGEEISIAVRAYTHGYDLFHPHKVIAWHEYTRRGRTKQWDDDKTWSDKNNKCHLKNRKLFSMDGQRYDPKEFGIYGFGTIRSLDDYEKYAGISFSRRAVQQETLDNKYPPNTITGDWDKSLLNRFKHCIDLQFTHLPEDDYSVIVVAAHSEDGSTIHRVDYLQDDLNRWRTDPDNYLKIWLEFNSEIKVDHWVVWAHSVSKGWGDRITGKLN